MCVIAAKPKGVEMPQWEIIKQMWDKNPDGAGLMWLNKDNKVEISKGYMKYEDFERQVKSLGDLTNIPVVMHFRITTHGGTSPENTHPFPVSDNIEHLKALDVISNLGVAHNGVINTVPEENENSDTQVYIRDILTPLSLVSKYNFLDEFKTLINATITSSKLAFLDVEGAITVFGNWSDYDKAPGVKFSNTFFKPTTTTTTTYYNNSKYTQTYNYDYTFEDTAYYKLKPYYKDSFITKQLGIDGDDILQYFEVNQGNKYLFNHTQNTVIDASTITSYRFYMLSDEQAISGIESGYINDKVQNNIGGKNNEETKNVRMNANRELLKYKHHTVHTVRQLKVGTELYGFYYDDDSETGLIETYTLVTQSDNWFIDTIHDEILYKQKDGKYVVVSELQMKSDINKSTGKRIRLRNIDVYYNDDAYWRI